jgi:hypothetical protein
MGDADLVVDGAAIVRREIRLAARRARKDLDVLAQVAPERAGAVLRFAERHDIHAETANGDESSFPQMLARARVFLSDTGLGFREALAAGAHPVAWCDRASAVLAFRKAGARPAIIQREDDLFLLHGLLSAGTAPHPRATDGTRAVVETLWKRIEAASADPARPSQKPARIRRARTR